MGLPSGADGPSANEEGSGAKTVLWNRKARYRRIGCQGFVEFQAKQPSGGYYQGLVADDGQ